jgi:hypothetical protein
MTELESARVRTELPFQVVPTGPAYLEKCATSLARANLCASDAARYALQDDRLIQGVWDDAQGHLIRVAARFQSKAIPHGKVIRDETPIPDFPT